MTRQEKNIYMREWSRRNPEKILATRKRRLQKTLAYNKIWRVKNRERYLASRKAYRLKHKARIRVQSAKCHAKRKTDPKRLSEYLAGNRARTAVYRTNPNFLILCRLRKRLWTVLNGAKKSEGTEQLLGCSLDDFRIYLESRWQVGMHWGNYGNKQGQWSIDHIIPCAIFDLSKAEHQRRCFHFSNMQPLWHVENLSKHKKVTTNQFNLL